MGKRQHQSDKMYLTYTEWSTLYGGRKANSGNKDSAARLPFGYCCLGFNPSDILCCDSEGNLFDMENIIKWIKKFKNNPVTGKPLDAKSIIKLNFSKSADGKFECPVIRKPLGDHSHVVAIATTGNVFSYEAVDRLNLKPKMWKDLLNDEPFQKKDIITLQDPKNLEKFQAKKFYHVRKNIRLDDGDETPAEKKATLKNTCKETQEILEALKKEYVPPKKENMDEKKADKFNAAHFSTGAVAAGFTSTAVAPSTHLEPAILPEDVVRYERVKKKGYLTLVTNLGPLNLELHCEMVPKTCENFMKLCQSGYYDGTVFHRSIRHFMIQGGDPTGTGNGGKSYWGDPFEDEFKPNLNHEGRGILSMANAGPGTNKSQFFITYRSCKYLDGKHTVFGRVVGGMDTLANIERIEVDNKDRPISDIKIISTQIYVDPFQEVDEKLLEERRLELERQEESAKPVTAPTSVQIAFKKGIGKYINPDASKPAKPVEEIEKSVTKNKPQSYQFGNFSSW
ncbi:Rtf2 RING-finger [Nesidiocoris tenuis]|uniref:Rtf2 RING-finger n=1 Tax=Nesidiocoris tenuis TaxID=355587 RepID=A0ABN7A540_9HEMI|nr:Rtf2 RING-finger [Nesidiocoris tenuis]